MEPPFASSCAAGELQARRTRVISLHALERSKTTIEDFCSSYLPLHGVDVRDGVFRFLDVIVFVSASLYELDELNEQSCSASAAELPGTAEAAEVTASARVEAGLAVLREALSGRGLLDARVLAELASGEAYWSGERRLCGQLARGEPLDEATVWTTHASKSFDYRVLHCCLIQLLHLGYDERLLAFLRVDERLVDIGDDLTDYEDDVVANSFNIYRCLLALERGRAQSGTEAAASSRLFQLISSLETEHARLLAQLGEEQRRLFWERHAAATSCERSGKWVVPPAVTSEAEFRRQFGTSTDHI